MKLLNSSKSVINRFLFDVLYKKPYGKTVFNFDRCDTSKYRRFNSSEMATHWAKKFYGDWTKNYEIIYGSGMSNSLRQYMEGDGSDDPIRNYCGFGAKRLNGFLRKNIRPLIDQRSYNDALATLLLLAPRIPENIVVYRYVPDIVIDIILKNNKLNELYTDQGFTSCSLLFNPPDKSFFDYNNVLELYIDQYTAGVYVNLISSCKRQEFELLILRNSQSYLIDYPYKKNNLTIYPMRLRNIVGYSEFLLE